MITKLAHEDANIIWGAAFDESMEDEMTVTVIATGFASHNGNVAEEKPAAAPAPAEAPVPPGEPYRQNRPRHPWGSRSGPGARSPHPGG